MPHLQQDQPYGEIAQAFILYEPKTLQKANSTIHLCGHQAQPFSWKEKLSLTPCLYDPAQLTACQGSGILPLALLASLPGLLSFQTALKVTWSQAYLKWKDKEAD